MQLMIAKGYTFIESIVAVALLVIVGLVFWGLLKTGISASDRGKTSAQARENARIAVDRIQAELRQAAPVPTGGQVIGGQLALPAVIYPAPGGTLLNAGNAAEPAGIGCSLGAGNCVTVNASPLNPSVAVLAGSAQQAAAGPTGFVIFSELVKSAGGLAGDPTYNLNLANYVWVMYQINPSVAGAPATLVRYTFPVVNAGALQGIQPSASGWTRANNYFVPANSMEGANNGVPVVSLSRVQDQMWIMVSHGALQQSVNNAIFNMTGDTYDPQLLNVTAVVNQVSPFYGFGSSQMPGLTSTLSSQVKVEGGSLF